MFLLQVRSRLSWYNHLQLCKHVLIIAKFGVFETKIELPVQISLIGHSAGGQMCAMALLHRAKALSKHRKHEGKASGQETGLTPAEERMPASFIGKAFRAESSSVKLVCSLQTLSATT